MNDVSSWTIVQIVKYYYSQLQTIYGQVDTNYAKDCIITKRYLDTFLTNSLGKKDFVDFLDEHMTLYAMSPDKKGIPFSLEYLSPFIKKKFQISKTITPRKKPVVGKIPKKTELWLKSLASKYLNR